MESDMNEAVAVAAPQKRRVGFILGLGILFFPVLFGWLVLRKGHSTLARIVVLPWLLLGVLSFLFIGASIKTAFDATRASRGKTVQPESVQASTEPLKAYASTQVAQDYEANTVAADMMYKGKRVQVSGRIKDINTDMFGDPYVVLPGTNQFTGPQFKFDKTQMQQIASLKKGDMLTVTCTGNGDVAKTPMFKDCLVAE